MRCLFDEILFCRNKEPALPQALRILCESKMFLCQWIVCFLEFKGALDDASKDAKLCVVSLGFEKVIGIFTHGSGKEEG